MLPITLDGNDVEQKREEILNYFLDGFKLFEKQFEILKDDTVFYRKSEPTRHPMIFYFGHTATFFINKLILSKTITKRLNPHFESIFAIGVDEMSWDDLDESNYNWPSVDEVRAYRDEVKKVVTNLIKTLPLTTPIKQDSPFWVILMGCEHERIHIETSSVLHRQMPLEFIKEHKEFTTAPTKAKTIKNSLVTIPATKLRLGKDKSHHLYGWDNEYGENNYDVESFQTSKYLVTNDEYLEFVKDNGYMTKEYWDEEGLNFLKNKKVLHPVFWKEEDDGTFSLRVMTKNIPLPLSWPVEVNALEAKAYLRYLSNKDGINYTLPSEEQYYSLYEYAKIQDVPNFDDKKANINLKHHYSPCDVDEFCFGEVFDVVGNIWQWSRTPIYPFEGFEIHPVYDDFSVPTFDDKHNLIKGGSFISTGNELMKHSRYAFRRHFYQHAGFRYVVGEETIDIKQFNKNDDNFIQDQIDKFSIKDNYNQIIEFIKENDTKSKNIFEIGCTVGALSNLLASNFEKVISCDTTARIIQEAQKLKDETQTNLEFWQVDPCNIKPHFKEFDMVILNDILSRTYSKEFLLGNIHPRLNNKGILITITKENENISLLEKHFNQKNKKLIEEKTVTIWEKNEI